VGGAGAHHNPQLLQRYRMIGKNGQTLSANNRACRCGCLPRRLRVCANAHIPADRGPANTYRDSFGISQSIANCHADHRAADAYRVAFYAYKLTANCHTNHCAADAHQHGYRRATD
jgi:hypothetical protein